MAMYRTGTVVPGITIIGKDLDAGATFNGDTVPALGVLKAGTLMKYTGGATKVLAKATVGTDTVFGVLADDVDTGAVGATEIPVVMVYRRGTFLRQEIESANNAAITPGSAVDIALSDLGIHLELSYEGYEGLSPVPGGVEPMGFGENEPEAEAAQAQFEERRKAGEEENKKISGEQQSEDCREPGVLDGPHQCPSGFVPLRSREHHRGALPSSRILLSTVASSF